MVRHTPPRVVSPSIIFAIAIIAIAFTELVLAVPITRNSNDRVVRSVNSHRRSSRNEEDPEANLLLTQKHNDTQDSVLAQRNTQSGGGTSFAEDDGDGSNEVEVDDGDGAFSNDTRAGSRLKQNSTEPCSLVPASLCSTVDTHSNRDKAMRLASIKSFLWTVFGNRTRPPVNKELMEQFNPVNPSSTSFSGVLESIIASCDLPSEVESEAWSSKRYFSMYFNLTSKYPNILGASLNTSAENSTTTDSQQKGAESESGHSQEYIPVIGSRPFFTTLTVTPSKPVNIISAKLRLYKIGMSENANSVPSSVADIERNSEPCNDTDVNSVNSDEEDMPSMFSITKLTLPEFTPSVDEKIRVSVFWYTQPPTKNHYKKKLVDAKMLTVRESSWVEFDIKNAVTAWLNERKPNYGLVIEVENENQDLLDPRLYFRGTPCFKSAPEGAHRQDDSGSNEGNERSGDVNPTMSPIVQICTISVPETTTNYEQFLPFSININSLNHLHRVAESHARSNGSASRPSFPQNLNMRVLSPEDFGIVDPNKNGNSNNNDDGSETFSQTIVVPNHRHRHHHQFQNDNNNNNSKQQKAETTGEKRGRHQRGKARSDSNDQFTLDEDHPLRHILSRVNGNSKESGERGSGRRQSPESTGKDFSSHFFPEMPADEGRAEADSTEHDRDVFITKIIISPAQLKQNALNRFATKGGFLPFASSMPTSASRSSAVSPTVTTNVDSAER